VQIYKIITNQFPNLLSASGSIDVMGKGKNREIYAVLVVIIPAVILSAVYLPWWAALAGAAPLLVIVYSWHRRNKLIIQNKKAKK
jgi:hypothetical protein